MRAAAWLFGLATCLGVLTHAVLWLLDLRGASTRTITEFIGLHLSRVALLVIAIVGLVGAIVCVARLVELRYDSDDD